MPIQLDLGLDIIRSYKRLSYSPWHALAELVDNSTQSHADHKTKLDAAYEREGDMLEVSIVYSRQDDVMRIADNAMGMSFEELDRALHVGARPENTSGRSEFGMGLKTAACWFGDVWSVRTKKLGETVEYKVTVDVEAVAEGDNELPYEETPDRDPEKHYTIIEIERLHRKLHGRTVGRIRAFLASMYRHDIRTGALRLLWQGEPLPWEESDDRFLKAADGSRYKKDYEFLVDDKRVNGWVGVLDRGSREKAGFSILRRGRVIRGYPDSWRPETLFGQFLGTNDLVNQRLTGEVNLDEFEVSHTKDNIDWFGDQEQQVQDKLKEECWDYREIARQRRKGADDERGPSDLEIQTAVEELQQELTSSEIIDLVSIETIPPPEVVREGFRPLLESISTNDEPSYSADLGTATVKGYLANDPSPNDPYVLSDSTSGDKIVVVVNMNHPYLEKVVGSEGFLNYLRHCTYDAIAEWQAAKKVSQLDPDTIKILKDKLLRLPLDIEMHAIDAAGSGDAGEGAKAS
jgi:hypothetical protein